MSGSFPASAQVPPCPAVISGQECARQGMRTPGSKHRSGEPSDVLNTSTGGRTAFLNGFDVCQDHSHWLCNVGQPVESFVGSPGKRTGKTMMLI